MAHEQTIAWWHQREEERRARIDEAAKQCLARVPEVARLLEREFGATEVILFGSLVEGAPSEDFDVDIAVRGISPARFFEAMGQASALMQVQVELVELDTARPSLAAAIRKRGRRVLCG